MKEAPGLRRGPWNGSRIRTTSIVSRGTEGVKCALHQGISYSMRVSRPRSGHCSHLKIGETSPIIGACLSERSSVGSHWDERNKSHSCIRAVQIGENGHKPCSMGGHTQTDRDRSDMSSLRRVFRMRFSSSSTRSAGREIRGSCHRQGAYTLRKVKGVGSLGRLISREVSEELEILGIQSILELDDRGIVASIGETNRYDLAEALSRRFRGQWRATDGWISYNPGGGKGRHGLHIMDVGQLESALSARECYKRILEREAGVWSPRSIARLILEWMIEGEEMIYGRAKHDGDYYGPKIMNGWPEWAYARCIPGEYVFLALYDIKSAYWQMLKRLPGLFPRLSKRRYDSKKYTWCGFGLLSLQGEERWEIIKQEADICKPVRLAFHGLMKGGRVQWRGEGYGGNPVHTSGTMWHSKPYPGMFPVAALLTARAVYELCWEQAMEGSAPYAAVDCVMLWESMEPLVWRSVGLDFHLDAIGEASVKAHGNYKVGSKRTKFYLKSDYLVPDQGSEAPDRLTYRDWM